MLILCKHRESVCAYFILSFEFHKSIFISEFNVSVHASSIIACRRSVKLGLYFVSAWKICQWLGCVTTSFRLGHGNGFALNGHFDDCRIVFCGKLQLLSAWNVHQHLRWQNNQAKRRTHSYHSNTCRCHGKWPMLMHSRCCYWRSYYRSGLLPQAPWIVLYV